MRPQPLEWLAGRTAEKQKRLDLDVVLYRDSNDPVLVDLLLTLTSQAFLPRSIRISSPQDAQEREQEELKALSAVSNCVHFVRSVESSKAGELTRIANKGSAGSILFLEPQDLLLPGSLESIHHAGQRSKSDVTYGSRVVVDQFNRRVGQWDLPSFTPDILLWRPLIPRETFVCSRSSWNAAGSTLDYNYQHLYYWDLQLRLYAIGAKFERREDMWGATRTSVSPWYPESEAYEEYRSLLRRTHNREIGSGEVDENLSLLALRSKAKF